MRRMAPLAPALLLAACTASNPEYLPAPPFADGPEEADLRGVNDRVDLASLDPAACSAGERRCRQGEAGRWLSQRCQQGDWLDDRLCPQGSLCSSGYCQPPPRQGTYEGRACVRENDCFNPQQPNTPYSCQPFVRAEDRQVQGFCAVQISPPGTGWPGTVCLPGEGWICRTGFCDEVSRRTGGLDTNYCFRTCTTDADCPNAARYCQEARITVEQVTYLARSCVPVR